jgi:hypothetical protein
LIKRKVKKEERKKIMQTDKMKSKKKEIKKNRN